MQHSNVSWVIIGGIVIISAPLIELITTTCEGTAYTTPSTLSDLTQSEGTPLNEPQTGHLLSNILAQNERLEDTVAQKERLEDVVAGLSFENELMSSRLQMARAENSQLQQDQEEELSQQQEAMAISKFDILTNWLHHAPQEWTQAIEEDHAPFNRSRKLFWYTT